MASFIDLNYAEVEVCCCCYFNIFRDYSDILHSEKFNAIKSFIFVRILSLLKRIKSNAFSIVKIHIIFQECLQIIERRIQRPVYTVIVAVLYSSAAVGC